MSDGLDGSSDEPGLLLSGLDLDDLLDELRERARAVHRSRERLSELLDSVVAVSSDLDLPTVLRRIVRAACRLADARYGALGVLARDGRELSEFVTEGISDEDRARIGDLPRGHGLLGLLIRHPRAVRVHDIGAHPDSSGLPVGHPPMTTFLGLPIRVRGQVFGNLYLTDKPDGADFTDDDEVIVRALASAAGVAIENARLYERTERQRRWSEAITEVTRTLLRSGEDAAALTLLARRAVDLSEAALAVVALQDGDRLSVQAVNDDVRCGLLGLTLAGPPWPEVVAGRVAMLAEPLPDDVRRLREAGGLPPQGPVAAVPLTAGDSGLGALVVAWAHRDDGRGVQRSGVEELTGFAQQAALALTAARSHRDRNRMRVLEDRDRIARDMHDHVIQRLFATGLSLQAMGRLAEHPVLHARLDEAIDEIDRAIKDIRQAIFALQHPLGPGGLVEELQTVLRAAAPALGFVPRLELDGLVGDLPEPLVADVLAVVREALANVARHARAGAVVVQVVVTDEVVVRVEDDGHGMPAQPARSGLLNLARRAAGRSGSLHVDRRTPSGTVLTWQVPAAAGT